MKNDRKSYNGEWKAKVALEAIKGQRTINEIASDYKVHPTQIMNWKKQALEQLPEMFSDKRQGKVFLTTENWFSRNLAEKRRTEKKKPLKKAIFY